MLIQIVPRRTAEPNGVADYASALARALREGNGIGSVFLSATTPAQAPPLRDEWETIALPQRQAQFLTATIRSLSARTKASAVLLHFSGYGYQERGIPLWLARGLQDWKRQESHVPLVTVFHELYATSRPWRSAFWFSPIQKQIARGILDLSLAAITPTNVHARHLSEWAGRNDDKMIKAMPVFSNVGEAGRGSLPHARTATAVVFGLAGVEDRLFGTYRSEFERVVLALGIEKILDVGPRFSQLPNALAGVPIISKGALPPSEVSKLLQDARFGVIAYPVDVIGKSGVFAAYAAHGVVPIVFSDEDRLGSSDGLGPRQHFVDGLRLGTHVRPDELASIQRELCTWYASHNLEVQANYLAGLMKFGSGGPQTTGSRARSVEPEFGAKGAA